MSILWYAARRSAQTGGRELTKAATRDLARRELAMEMAHRAELDEATYGGTERAVMEARDHFDEACLKYKEARALRVIAYLAYRYERNEGRAA